MILIDTNITYKKNRKYRHMVSDDIDYLHTYAQSIGLKRCWFHNKKGKPHYDVPEKYFNIIEQDNTVQKVTTKDLIRFLEKNYGKI